MKWTCIERNGASVAASVAKRGGAGAIGRLQIARLQFQARQQQLTKRRLTGTAARAEPLRRRQRTTMRARA